MPERLKPGRTFAYVLEGDRDDESPIRFNLTIISAADEYEFLRLNQEYISTRDADRREAIEAELLDRAVAAVDGDLLREELRQTLTTKEIWELIHAVREGAALSPEQRKKFVSVSSSGSAGSVEGAELSDAKQE
jgi:hypothetical protein